MKYKVPVFIQTTASKVIGHVEVDSIDRYKQEAEKLWESLDNHSPSVNVHNDFELHDWDLVELNESDLEYYKNDSQ